MRDDIENIADDLSIISENIDNFNEQMTNKVKFIDSIQNKTKNMGLCLL